MKRIAILLCRACVRGNWLGDVPSGGARATTALKVCSGWPDSLPRGQRLLIVAERLEFLTPETAMGSEWQLRRFLALSIVLAIEGSQRPICCRCGFASRYEFSFSGFWSRQCSGALRHRYPSVPLYHAPPSAKSMETSLWQTRSKFEPRSAGGINFYLRRDPESKREVAFAVSGDYLLLATREDLMAGALTLMSGKPDRNVESEQWWALSTGASPQAGDLRMVLDLGKLVPNGYFRTYWVQQNITDLSQYSAAVSDLFRDSKQYREERVLIRKQEKEKEASAEGLAAAADLVRLVPDDAGIYLAKANPTADSCFSMLETKLLAPHLGSAPASQMAPQVQLTSGEQGGASDLETRIDQVPPERTAQSTSGLQELLNKTPILASLQVQSTERDSAGVFVRIHSGVVLMAASEWNGANVQSALTDFVRPTLTASQLGVGWQQKSGYQQLDGLWPLAVSVHGKYLLVSDAPALIERMLANFGRKSDRQPASLLAGFDHAHERANFVSFARLVDRPNVSTPTSTGIERQPQFFSGNMASLSSTLSAVAAERIEVRGDGGTVRQTVTYQWTQ